MLHARTEQRRLIEITGEEVVPAALLRLVQHTVELVDTWSAANGEVSDQTSEETDK